MIARVAKRGPGRAPVTTNTSVPACRPNNATLTDNVAMGNAEVTLCGSIDRHEHNRPDKDRPRRINTLSDINPESSYDKHRPSVTLEEMHRRLSLQPDPVASDVPDDDRQKALREKLYNHLKKPANQTCADCDANIVGTDPWVSTGIGAIVCLRCSGVHRSLGTHVSKMRSVQLDLWDEAAAASVLSTDNVEVNKIYEFHVPPDVPKPREASDHDVRERFITAKYRDSAFVQKADVRPLAPTYDEV